MKKGSHNDEGTRQEAGFPLNRRQFLQGLGGGIIIFFSHGMLTAQERRAPGAPQLPTDFNAYVRIAPDGQVSCFTGKIEMGQGIVTSLAQILAEELDVSVASVEMVMGDTDLCPWDNGTFGSLTTRFFAPPLREAAAEARAVLIELAAERLGVDKARLVVKDGVVKDGANGKKRVTFGQLAQGKSIERHVTPKPPVKKVAQYAVVGKPTPVKDAAVKVTGKAQYAGDIRVPGMLCASILRPPAHGATLKHVDTSAVEADKEVRLVRDGDLIAVLHRHPDMAAKALARIKAQWDVPPSTLDPDTIYAHLLRVAPEGEAVSQGGNLEDGRRLARKTYDATFYDHYMAHATIETHTAVAKPEGDRMIVWASTQRPFGAKEEVARALAIPPQKVRIMTPFVGAGFGGKSMNQQAVEAARLAKLTGQPVQVAWSRKEEFFFDSFRPAAIGKVQAGVDGANRIAFFSYDVYFAGPRDAAQIYAVPNHRELSHGHYTGIPGAHPFATGPWRSPGANFNVFARECHLDAMAAALGLDPLEFRLQNLADRRMLRVFEVAAKRFGWKKGAAPGGRGIGLACAVDAGTYVVGMGEVEVDPATGRVKVKRILCAQDMGVVINPEGATTQIEGSLTMGMGQALTEEVRFKGRAILDENFDTYEIPRFSWLPKIETVLVDNPDVAPQGGGEPPIVVVAALIGNAIFDATGARLYDLPMTPARVKEALARAERPRG